ncbi:MAG: hypothetical protein AB7T07_09315 [Steroidobacteraceae bacterium]
MLVISLLLVTVAVEGKSNAESAMTLPGIGLEYGKTISVLPDWNGYWLMAGDKTGWAYIMFDSDNVYEPPDPAGEIGGVDFGPRPGTYNTKIPYKPEYKKLYEDRIQMAMQGRSVDPVGGCMQPHGMPRQMSGIPLAPEILITPAMVLMSWTHMGAQRRIYTDGRSHPASGEIAPDFMGHSVGHWEGDTLVIDTVNILAGIYDQSGAPFSDQVHVMERIRLVKKDTLENQITVEDPIMLEHPWQVTKHYLRAEPRYQDFVQAYCPPGTAVDMSKGYQELVLPSELEQKKQMLEPNAIRH